MQEHKSKKIVRVVAGLLWRDDSVLIQQRPADKALALLWEFPGGKVEVGESDEHALQRECLEELGVELHIGARLWQTVHDYETMVVELVVYATTLAPHANPSHIYPHAAAALCWATRSDLGHFDFCPADVPLVRLLQEGEL